MKNSTLTGASWTSLSTNMEYDVTATAMTTSVDGIYQNDYVTSSAQGRAVLAAPTGYNFAYQLGTSLAGVSDTFTLGIRVVSGATTGDAYRINFILRFNDITWLYFIKIRDLFYQQQT
jgi:hypothetical protein